jgi:hypothetical protein
MQARFKTEVLNVQVAHKKFIRRPTSEYQDISTEKSQL